MSTTETRPTSSRCWVDSLAQTVTRWRAPDRPARVVVVGIGHELRGDDAAGVAVARALQARLPKSGGLRKSYRVTVIDAGPAPENFTGPLRRLEPDLALLVDAAQMDEAPGAVRWLAWPEVDGFDASTHTLPPRLVAQYLSDELGCQVALIGIQPADTSIDAPLSADVQTAVDEVVKVIETYLLD